MSIKFGDLDLSAIGAHTIIYIGEFLIWRPLPNSPNCQIKNLAKVSHYTVHVYIHVYIYNIIYMYSNVHIATYVHMALRNVSQETARV